MAKDVQMSIKMEHELRGRFMVMQWITDAQPLRSQFRPIPAGRGNYPILIIKASCNPIGCPVFG